MVGVEKIVTEAILRRIVERNVFTIPDIVEDTGASMTTIAKYVDNMLATGQLEALETVKTGSRGRRPTLYGIRKGSKCFLGVDVKSDELIIALMDYAGKMVCVDASQAFVIENSASKLEEVCVRIESFLADKAQVSKESIMGMCITLGGRVDSRNGTSASLFNLEELSGNSLAGYLAERLGFPVYLENDTKSMAYAEYLAVADRGYKDLLLINIGWGLGLGIIIDGKIYYGKNGYSGEFGHTHVYDNDIMCHCGKKGCLETEVSGRAIYRMLLERIKGGESSILAPKYFRGESITMKDIIRTAGKEDPLCVDLLSRTGTELGKQISSLVNIFNPECIIVGGALSRAASYYFFYPMLASIRKYSLKLMNHDLSIQLSKLGEESGVFGACLIARQRYFGEINQKEIKIPD